MVIFLIVLGSRSFVFAVASAVTKTVGETNLEKWRKKGDQSSGRKGAARGGRREATSTLRKNMHGHSVSDTRVWSLWTAVWTAVWTV